MAFGFINTRLTQDKGLGASIEVNGQQVALGIPSRGGDGGSATAGIPLGRSASAEEAAAGVLFLCSPLASYVSGRRLVKPVCCRQSTDLVIR